MTGLPLFDRLGAASAAAPARRPSAGEQLRDRGIARVESRDPSLAEVLRARARLIAAEQGRVTIDDVRDWMDAQGLVAPHKNFYGAIFIGPDWVCVGREPSRRVENHGHRNNVWALRR